jgi:broad specificity phosphatase PhoE
MRHATTDANGDNRVRSIADMDINDEGRQDAMRTAQQLSGIPISEIVTGDLSRTEQTAQILGNQFFAPVSTSRNLREWDMGKFIGEKFGDVKDELTGYIKNPRKRIPGGEAYQQFSDRWREGLGDLVSRAMQGQGAVVGVTHSKNLELTRQWISGEKDHEKLNKADSIPPAGVMALQIRDGKLVQIPFGNEHLVKESE